MTRLPRIFCYLSLLVMSAGLFACGGCPFAADRQVTSGRYGAGGGEVCVEKELYLAGELLDSHSHAKVSLVYCDESGYQSQLILESDPTFSLQRSADAAVTLQEHDTTPNWLSPLAEHDGTTHVYVDADEVGRHQFDAIAECLTENLSDIEDDCNKQEKHAGKQTAPLNFKLASVRHYDARLHAQSYVWEKNRKVKILIGTPGNVWLEMESGSMGKTITRTPSTYRCRIGIVLPDAQSILTSDPAKLMGHPSFANPIKLKAALEEHPEDWPQLFDQCLDFEGQTIGERFDLKMAPSWEACLHGIALARMDSDGGVARYAGALSSEDARYDATAVLCDAGPLASGARDGLLESLQDGNPKAVDALLNLGVDRQAIVDAMIVWLKDSEAYDTDLDLYLKKLYPESKTTVPYLVELVPSPPYHPTHGVKACFDTMFQLDPESELAQQAYLDHFESSEARNRKWAAEAASQYELPREKILPVLTASLEDPDGCTRVAAAKSLYQLGEPAESVLPTLLKELDESGFPQSDAIHALRQMGPDAAPAIPQLRRLANDRENLSTVRNAKAALRKIEGE